MSTLVDAMLETARVVGEVFDGTADSGTSTTVVDGDMDQTANMFKEGTLWVLSGTYDGACKIIRAQGGSTLTFDALASAIVADVTFAVAPKKFPKNVLKAGVLTALRDVVVLKQDVSLTTEANQESITLPSGVSRVTRLEIASSTSAPYEYQINYGWDERFGEIILKRALSSAGYKIRLTYIGSHGDIAETADVDDTINMTWLKWAAAVNCWRTYVSRNKLNDKDAVRMLNEALQKEAFHSPGPALMARDPKLSGY